MRSTKLLIPKSVQVGELLELVKVEELERLSQSLEADKWVTKFKASIVFHKVSESNDFDTLAQYGDLAGHVFFS